MKPVNLLPSDAAVKAVAASGKPNLGMIGGAVVGVVCIVGVAAYFAMARVDSVKSEAQAAQQRASQATQETSAVQAQVASLGQPVVDSDRQLAQGAEAVLVSAYTERHNFVLLAQELRGIMPSTGWYETVTATSGAAAEEKAVEITGYMPTKELVASFNERAEGTRSLENAEHQSLESERLTDLETKRPGVYWKFVITADLNDTLAPSADAGGSAASDGTGTTVNGGGGTGGELTLSLNPKPTPKAAPKKAAKPKAPKNPFDIAANNAAKGGGA